MTKTMKHADTEQLGVRTKIVMSAVFIFASILIYRLADLQLVSGAQIEEAASRQHSTARILPAERGNIFYGGDREEYPVAINRAFNHAYIVPKDINGIDDALKKLLPIVEKYGVDQETLLFRLSKENDIYEPLAHKLTDEELQSIIDLNLPGIEWEKETWRYYSDGPILSHITGFVGVSGENRIGQYGIEGFFEEELKGKNGLIEGKTDISGRLIQSSPLKRIEPEAGVDLLLTIDRTLQTFACQHLEEKIQAVSAESGSVIVVRPDTGAVLVMCSYPSFDPNKYNEVEDISVFMNSAISSAYEPGSTFKSITLSSAIDAGAINSQTTYVDEGVVEIGKYKIQNADLKAHGEVNMITVLDESLNTGAIFAQSQIGNEKFRDYVEKFGFGRTTDIGLGNEISGDISSLKKSGNIYAATASFGQGISITPIQLVMAYGAIANNGKLMKPYIVSEKRKNGSVIYKAEPSVVDRPISVQASTIISGMLVSAVRNGHAKRAGVKGYYIAAKTGTAQVAEGAGYGAKTIHSVAGFGPVDNPAFVMLAKIDYPEKGRFAESTAAPLFGEIAKFILQYYEVPPDEL